MCQCIETRSSGSSLGERIHQLGIDNRAAGDVIRIHTNHLLVILLVDDDIVDGSLGSSTCSRWEADHGHALMLGRSYTFEADNVAELRIVGHNTNSLGSIHRRAATDGNHKVGLGVSECLHTILHVGYGWIGHYIRVDFVRDASLIHNVGHHLAYAKFNQTFVGYHEGFLETKTCNHCGQFLASTSSEVAKFIKNKTVYHNSLF